MAPTKVAIVSFTSAQTMAGISASQFTSNPQNSLVFRQSVANFMPPLNSDNINITGVADTSRRLEETVHRRLAGGISIAYLVTFNPYSSGFTDVTAAYNSFTDSLTTALTDGSFNSYMQSTASDAGLTELAAANSTGVAFSEPTVIADDDTATSGESHKKDNHHALIVGITVGLGGGLIVIALIAYFVFYVQGSSSSTGSKYVENNDNAPHEVRIVFRPDEKEGAADGYANPSNAISAVPADESRI